MFCLTRCNFHEMSLLNWLNFSQMFMSGRKFSIGKEGRKGGVGEGKKESKNRRT